MRCTAEKKNLLYGFTKTNSKMRFEFDKLKMNYQTTISCKPKDIENQSVRFFVNDVFVSTIRFVCKRCVSGRSRYNSEYIKVCNKTIIPKNTDKQIHTKNDSIWQLSTLTLTCVTVWSWPQYKASQTIILIWNTNRFDFRKLFEWKNRQTVECE